MPITYINLRVPSDVHEALKSLAEREHRTITATLRMLLAEQLSAQPIVLPDKPIEKPKSPPLTPATKPPFIRPLVAPKPKGRQYGDDSPPVWDESETMA